MNHWNVFRTTAPNLVFFFFVLGQGLYNIFFITVRIGYTTHAKPMRASFIIFYCSFALWCLSTSTMNQLNFLDWFFYQIISWFRFLSNHDTKPCLTELQFVCVSSAMVASCSQRFPVLISPESMQFQQYGDRCVPMPTPYQVLEGDTWWVFRSYHIKYLVFDIVKVDGFSAVGYHLFLDCLWMKITLCEWNFENCMWCNSHYEVNPGESVVDRDMLILFR